jgi:hypothetical protein
MGNDDAFGGLQAMAENVPDTRPVPPLVGLDRFFDEPEPSDDERIGGMLGWAAKATKEQRGGLVLFAAWCHQAPDAERRVIMNLMERYDGRLPGGAVNDLARQAGVSRERVRLAVNRFASFFPDAVSATRRRKG